VGTVLVSLWGKGGVGKTTLAAAAGLALKNHGLRVLLVSTDPTPGLSKLLCPSNSSFAPGEPMPCAGLDVVEASEEDVKELWKKRFGDEVYLVVSSLLPVGREIIDYVAGAPGITDQFTMYYVYTLAREGDYDVVVWDTPAAGGSLRMLRIEYELYSHMGDAARLYLRVKGTLEKLRRREGKTPLELIEEWRDLARSILDFLASPLHRLHIVATPDQLGVHVTQILLREFRLHGIEARRLIINQLLDPGMCPGCQLLESWAQSQRKALHVIQELGARTCTVPLLGEEPRSVEQLARLAELLEEHDCLDVDV